jgi:hypothetical protein
MCSGMSLLGSLWFSAFGRTDACVSSSSFNMKEEMQEGSFNAEGSK